MLEEVELIEGERLEIEIEPVCNEWSKAADGFMESGRSTWDCEGIVFKRGIDRTDRERGRRIVDQNGELADAFRVLLPSSRDWVFPIDIFLLAVDCDRRGREEASRGRAGVGDGVRVEERAEVDGVAPELVGALGRR